MTRVLSLCSGIGGLELAFPEWDIAAFAETDTHAATVLAVRFPGVPILGDWTLLDTFDDYSPDVITAGLPCQPVSAAGAQAGADDERWLFDDLIRCLNRTDRKPWLFLENVSAIRSRQFRTEMMRFRNALTAVGYRRHTELTVKASDIGAPHKRRRWFMLAAHPDSPPLTFDHQTPVMSVPAAGHVVTLPTPLSRDSKKGIATTNMSNLSHRILGDGELLKTPTAAVFGPEAPVSRPAAADGTHFRGGNLAGQLLPTPERHHGSHGAPGKGYMERNQRTSLPDTLLPTPMADQQAGRAGTERGDTRNLAQRLIGVPDDSLLPTTVSTDAAGVANQRTLPAAMLGGPPSRPREGIADLEGKVARHDWRQYQQAIDRWVELIDREPPELVVMPVGEGVLRSLHRMGLDYGPRVPAFWEIPSLLRLVNPQLPEWMMGFPYGWVTELLEPRPALKAIGNAVCPQQARLAATRLIHPPQPALF